MDEVARREGLYLLWLARVERRLIAQNGCEVAEFADYDFRGRYAAEAAPADVVAELLDGFEACLSSVDYAE